MKSLAHHSSLQQVHRLVRVLQSLKFRYSNQTLVLFTLTSDSLATADILTSRRFARIESGWRWRTERRDLLSQEFSSAPIPTRSERKHLDRIQGGRFFWPSLEAAQRNEDRSHCWHRYRQAQRFLMSTHWFMTDLYNKQELWP